MSYSGLKRGDKLRVTLALSSRRHLRLRYEEAVVLSIFVHHFGRRIGTIISVLDQRSSLFHLISESQDEDYYISVLASGYGDYNRQFFIDTLDDWQFFGPDSERPAWYTGKVWGQE
jgi:hypothetical protein